MAPPHEPDNIVLDGLLNAQDTRDLARRYLDIARKYTRELPALLPTKPHIICAFLASEERVLPLPPSTKPDGVSQSNPSPLNVVDVRPPLRRFIELRGDKKDPKGFWMAVDAMQKVLSDAARDSCDTNGGRRWTFEYSPLPSSTPKCEYCAKQDIDCLRTTNKSGICYACLYRKSTCVRPAKAAALPKRSLISVAAAFADGIVEDDRRFDKDFTDEDDDDEPVLSHFKRRRTRDMREYDKLKKRTSSIVVRRKQFADIRASSFTLQTPPATRSKPEKKISLAVPAVPSPNASPEHKRRSHSPRPNEVDAFLTVYGILAELVALVREYNCVPRALREALLDTTALRVPAAPTPLARHLRALPHASFARKGVSLRFAAQRVLECAAKDGCGDDARVVFLVDALKGRVERCAEEASIG